MACGGCTPACPISALDVVHGALKVDESCIDCGKCVPFCPQGALILSGANPAKWPAFRPPDDNYDVIVIGGGPAGSTSARLLAEDGAKVLLLEKRPVVGHPQLCAEGVSRTGLTDVIPQIEKRWVSAPIEGAVLVSPSGKATTVKHPRAGFILERRVFDRDLFAMAGNSGARTLVSAPAREFIWDGDHIVGVEFEWRGQKAEAFARVFICADGVESAAARQLFPREHLATDQIHVAAQAVMTGVDVHLGFPEFHVGRELAPGGYAWVFPKGEGFANVGLGVNPSLIDDGSITAWNLLERFITKRFEGAGEVIELASGNVPTAKQLEKIAYRNVLFVGDAGRLTDPISGGGIANALLSAKIAAKIAKRALFNDTPEATEKALAEYISEWHKARGKQMAFYLKAKNIFAGLDDEDLEGICRLIDDRFGKGEFESIDIPGAIRSIIKERKLLWRIAKSLLPSF